MVAKDPENSVCLLEVSVCQIRQVHDSEIHCVLRVRVHKSTSRKSCFVESQQKAISVTAKWTGNVIYSPRTAQSTSLVGNK